MTKLNRDTLLAIFLLLACGVLMTASFNIREPDYGQLSPAIWPRILVTLMAVLSLIYLVQSIRMGPTTVSPDPERQPGIAGFFKYWRNVFFCFSFFGLYLLALPWVGMLVGGMLFVFLLLNALGGWRPRLVLLHAAIAVVSVGGMWALFNYGLGVSLPRGELFS
ncbi:MAG: tripartite tricarboxylate transporter TctB family protein [Burkholderiaceae bacterium]